MATTYRQVGAFNGTLPVPTEMVIGFLRDPAKAPHVKYTQFVPAPEIIFNFFTLHPDDPARLQSVNEYVWGYDDYRPTGKGELLRGKWTEGRVTRYDFPYTVGENTIRVWNNQGIDPKKLYDVTMANKASLHRSVRIVTAMAAGLTGGQTTDLDTLLGTTGVGFDVSSGEELDPATGLSNPNFQIIKKAILAVKRRIHLATNGAVNGSELCMVMSPLVAEKIAYAGEIVNYLKQSQFAKDLTDSNIANWSIPDKYAGVTLVVEDTPRATINPEADGGVADVTVSAEKDYIMSDDTVYFVSRVGGENGGLDGGYGFKNFSTVQLYHFGGEGRVEAFSEKKHELVEGHVVMEDKIVVPAPLSGFKLTDCLEN